MTSPILEESSQLVEPTPKPQNIVDTIDVPKSIPTPATEWAPRGKVIDDSARGTIFWEAELSEPEVEDDVPEKEDTQTHNDTSAVAQSWGKPFKIEWRSTNRLPFYRTRGLRQPRGQDCARWHRAGAKCWRPSRPDVSPCGTYDCWGGHDAAATTVGRTAGHVTHAPVLGPRY
jgi:hypothetical protein